MFTNHRYNYLTMCKQIADVGLNYCFIAVVLGAISLCADKGALAHLESTKYLFVNLRFNMCLNEV